MNNNLVSISVANFLLASFLETKPREIVGDLLNHRTTSFDHDFGTSFDVARDSRTKHPFDRLSIVEKFEAVAGWRRSTHWTPNRAH